MVLLSLIRKWAWQLGAALLAVLAIVGRIKTLEYQRDKARHRADMADARHEVAKTSKRIEKKKKEELSSSLEEVESVIEKGKNRKDFEGLDNLNNPNDW